VDDVDGHAGEVDLRRFGRGPFSRVYARLFPLYKDHAAILTISPRPSKLGSQLLAVTATLGSS